MIYVSQSDAMFIAFLLLLAGGGLLFWGFKILRKPKWHPKSIYDKPPKPVSFWEQVKAPWMTGWNMGMAYGTKKREERLRKRG